MLIRILGQAAGGKVASEDVVTLMAYTALNYLPIILILTGFVSVLLVVSRSYQSSEMVVWFVSGQSLWSWIRPVLTFGLPLVALTALLSFNLTPWANRESAQLRERFQQRSDLARVSPGRFQESSSADRVFFVEGVSAESSVVRNVFVNTNDATGTSIVVAKEGSIETDENGDRFVVLRSGHRYDGTPSQPDFQIMEFERYGLLISEQVSSVAGDLSAKALPTMALVANPNSFNRGELLWRAALPFMALLLLLLAIPLAFVNPRGGRSINLLLAVFLFVLYSNSVSIFQAAVVQDRIQLLLAWWPVHLVVALLVLGLFLWRLKVNSHLHPLVLWARLRASLRSEARS